jgi:hypothetical protein
MTHQPIILDLMTLIMFRSMSIAFHYCILALLSLLLGTLFCKFKPILNDADNDTLKLVYLDFEICPNMKVFGNWTRIRSQEKRWLNTFSVGSDGLS